MCLLGARAAARQMALSALSSSWLCLSGDMCAGAVASAVGVELALQQYMGLCLFLDAKNKRYFMEVTMIILRIGAL